MQVLAGGCLSNMSPSAASEQLPLSFASAGLGRNVEFRIKDDG